MKTGRFVIVGASLAGASAAAALREGGFEGEITLIGAEKHLPYNRPPLSKGYLRGQDRFEDQLVNPPSFYQDQRIALKLGVAATAVAVAYVFSSGPVLAGACWLREATGWDGFYAAFWLYLPLFGLVRLQPVEAYIQWWFWLFGAVGPG